MCFKTIMSFTSTFIAADISKNYFVVVEFTAVRWSLLARLATVSVLLFSWRGISCPSSYCGALVPSGPLSYCFGTRSRR